jgi:nudix-type nucleoside diphosphatase (YffH/AdpP family)
MCEERVRVREVRLLSDDWYVLKKTTFDYQRRDGAWQTQTRETYDRGNGAAILLYNVARGTVVLTRQFRFPAYVNGVADGMMIEACAGMLDESSPEECIRKEIAEETGYRVGSVRKLFEAFSSPGAVTERMHFFAAEYDPDSRPASGVGSGGGLVAEGEDIEVLEMPFGEALRLIETGGIQDAKTIVLLLYAKAKGWLG